MVDWTQIRGLLFDLDGTLITQQIDFGRMRERVLAVVAQYGVDPEPLRRLYVLELIERVRAELADGEPAEAAPCQDRLRRCDRFAADAHAAIVAIEVEAAAGARPFPGVPELLASALACGYRVGIVTRNCRPAVERVLAQHHIPCEVLLTRDDVPYVKPDPRHLLAAAHALALTPEHLVMCGDHPMDVQAGKRVGAATVGVLPAGQTAAFFADAEPDLVVTSVAELAEHLPGLYGATPRRLEP